MGARVGWSRIVQATDSGRSLVIRKRCACDPLSHVHQRGPTCHSSETLSDKQVGIRYRRNLALGGAKYTPSLTVGLLPRTVLNGLAHVLPNWAQFSLMVVRSIAANSLSTGCSNAVSVCKRFWNAAWTRC